MLVTGAANVTVTNSAAAVFSWTNPSSVNIRINSAFGPMTTFTASGLSAPDEERAGTFWCRVIDGANVSSLAVNVVIRRETLA